VGPGSRGEFRRATWAPQFDRSRAGRARSYEAFIPDEVADYEPSFGGATSELLVRADSAIRELNRRDPAPTSQLNVPVSPRCRA